MVQIIPATWRDLMDLHHLEQVCFERDAWPLLDLIGVLTLPATVRLKAVIGEKLVGFVSGDIRQRKGVGWVTTIAVLPEFRKQGIAQSLLIACELEMNMHRVRLCVRKSNAAAHRLYLHAGYKQVEIWKKYYSGNEDAIVFEKLMLNK